MLNDLDTMCLVKKMNLVTTHHHFISKHHVHNCTISLGLLPQSRRHVSSVLKVTAVPLDLGLTTVPGTHTNPNPAEFVSMFAGININNCVFQFSQDPVHGMPSSMTVNTDKDHQAPKLKR